MAIQRQLRNFAQRLYHGRPNGEIRNEVPVHNVHVDDTSATVTRGAHLLPETGKVRRKNRRCQFDQCGLLEPEIRKEAAFGNSNTQCPCGAGTPFDKLRAASAREGFRCNSPVGDTTRKYTFSNLTRIPSPTCWHSVPAPACYPRRTCTPHPNSYRPPTDWPRSRRGAPAIFSVAMPPGELTPSCSRL